MKNNALRHIIFKDCKKAMRLSVLLLVPCPCLSGIVSVYSAGILGNFADAVFRMDMAYGMQNAARLALCLLVTVVLLPVFDMIGDWIMLKNALWHDRMVLGRFLDKSYPDVAKLDAGDIQQRLDSDPNDLRIYWLQIQINFCMILVTAAFLCYAVRHIYWGFICCVISLMLVKICVPIALGKIRAKYDRETRDYQTKLRACEAEITEKPHIIRIFGLTEPLIGRMEQLFQTYFKNVFKKSAFCAAIADTAASYLDTFCILVILFVGAVMTAQGFVSAGQIVAMTGYFGVLNKLVENASYIISHYPILDNLAERMEVLYSDAEAKGESLAEPLTAFGLKDLSFTYSGHTVFEHLDLDVKNQEKIAVCGDNGSGKSTLAKLICGLYDNYDGDFLINGQEAGKTDIRDKRKQFAYAGQDPYLFCGTVKDNIRLGNLHASEEALARVMDEMNIGELAQKTVSMGQNDLSGGEKQKISIARALLKDAPVLVLDEPEGSLDAESIDKLVDFIKTAKKTVILITHDKRFLNAVERVIRL